jgi:uncharacterized protein YjbI with pentapeptide repeats
MPNQEHLSAALGGTKALNAWRDLHPGVTLDLQGADLRRIDLSAERFPGPDLILTKQPDGGVKSRPNYRPADLSGSNLIGADLTGADLTDVVLTHADLTDASLRGSCLARSIGFATKFVGADMSWSDLGWSTFGRADLSGAKLTRSDLTGADLSYALLRDAELGEVHFTEVRLRGALFTGARLSRSVFGGTDLATASWDGTSHYQRCYIDTASLYRTASTLRQEPSREREVEKFLERCGLEPEAIEVYRGQIGRSVDGYSAFISYSRADKDFATALYDALQIRGVRCWLDERSLLPGDDLYDEINLAIRRYDKVLLCCSKSSLHSWWVENEIDVVFEREQHSAREGAKRSVLIPLNLDGFLFQWDGGRAAQIRKRVAADFIDWQKAPQKFNAEVDRLAKSLALPASAGS